MTNQITFSSKDTFKAWQKKAQQLLNEAKAEEMRKLDEEFADVLADYEASKKANERVIADMTALMDRHPRNTFNWDTDADIMEAHTAAMGEIERINTRFHTKWGDSYEEYLQLVAALDKIHADAIKQTRNRADYQYAMAELAKREAEGSEVHA